jgi:propanediol dehydratase small subunit
MDLNPQQAEFLANYTNPNSDTFGNAKQSALRAKYSEEYSDNIMALMPDWLESNIGDYRRLKKAEKVLDKVLEMEAVDQEGKLDNQLLKTQADVAKFVGSTIGKKKYSTRNELTGANGEKLLVMPNELINKNAPHTSTE